LLGAYALDAVDADEAIALERHLETCPRCRAEVEVHRDTAATLAFPGTAGPPAVWDRIAAALEEVPPPLRLVADRAEGRPPLARRSVPLKLAAAAAAVAAAVIGLLGVNAVHQSHRLDTVQSALRGDAIRRAALAALADPRATKVELRAADPGAIGQVALLRDGSGYLVADQLRRLPPDRSYQLWALEDGARVSAGVLGNAPTVVAFHVAGAVKGFAVTEEAAGGVVASSRPPVVIGFVRPT
jgi:hypothetical protein